MPPELVDQSVRRSYAESVAWQAERRRWLRDHGVDPGEVAAVYAVLLASPGYVCALDRAKATALGADPALVAAERRGRTPGDSDQSRRADGSARALPR